MKEYISNVWDDPMTIADGSVTDSTVQAYQGIHIWIMNQIKAGAIW